MALCVVCVDLADRVTGNDATDIEEAKRA